MLIPKGADTMNERPLISEGTDEFNQQDYIKSGSSSDCTGLIPSAPLDDAEFESYQDVYSFLPPPPDRLTEEQLREGKGS